MELSQNIAQGLWGSDSPFMQLPCVDYDRYQKIAKKIKTVEFRSFLMMTKEERRKVPLCETEAEWAELEKAAEVFPHFDATVDGYVKEEGKEKSYVVHSGDVMTIDIEIEILGQKKEEERGYIHSNTYPFMKKDNFIVIITNHDGSRIFNFERVYFKTKKHTWSM